MLPVGRGAPERGLDAGRNGGDVQALLPKVAEPVRILSERVHLIGQGGVLARELAREEPARVLGLQTGLGSADCLG